MTIKRYNIWQKSNKPELCYDDVKELTNKSIKDYIERLKNRKNLRKTIKLIVLCTWLVLILVTMVMINFNLSTNKVLDVIGVISLICAFFIGLPVLQYTIQIDQSMPKDLILYPVISMQDLKDNEIYCTFKPYKYSDTEETQLFKPNKIEYDLEKDEDPYIEAYSYYYYYYKNEIDCLHLPKKEISNE